MCILARESGVPRARARGGHVEPSPTRFCAVDTFSSVKINFLFPPPPLHLIRKCCFLRAEILLGVWLNYHEMWLNYHEKFHSTSFPSPLGGVFPLFPPLLLLLTSLPLPLLPFPQNHHYSIIILPFIKCICLVLPSRLQPSASHMSKGLYFVISVDLMPVISFFFFF